MPLKPLALSLFSTCLVVAGPVSAEDVPETGNPVFDRTVDLIEREFFDESRLAAFRSAANRAIVDHTDLAGADSGTIDAVIDDLIDSLAMSHTGRFTEDEVAYYELVDVFRYSLRDGIRRQFPPRGAVRYEGVAMAVAPDDGRTFVTDVYDGGPADRGGLLVGDEILTVDGKPFDEIGSFRGKGDEAVTIAVRRGEGDNPVELTVDVERLVPHDMFVSAVEDSVETVEHDGFTVGTIRLWAYTDRRVDGVIAAAIAGPLADADGLVLDLRSRWGGAPPDAADFFVGGAPDMELIFRDGDVDIDHARWRKPIVAIIDEGTRSGMEILAYALKENGVPLIGMTTAADVVAGRGYWLPDGSMLEIAVADVFVDGRRLEGTGVDPDIVVPFDIRYAAGDDPQFDAALSVLADRIAAAQAMR